MPPPPPHSQKVRDTVRHWPLSFTFRLVLLSRREQALTLRRRCRVEGTTTYVAMMPASLRQ